jgi:hypothetical protein
LDLNLVNVPADLFEEASLENRVRILFIHGVNQMSRIFQECRIIQLAFFSPTVNSSSNELCPDIPDHPEIILPIGEFITLRIARHQEVPHFNGTIEVISQHLPGNAAIKAVG